MSKITPAAVETLARIDAVGLALWITGEPGMASLNDASLSPVNVATVKSLLRNGFLEESGDILVISATGTAELAQHPETRGRAREFYEKDAGLAELGFHSAQSKPDFKRPRGTPTA